MTSSQRFRWDKSTVIKALSEVHVEFELIHPFREGNGRVGRVLITLMALEAGLPLLNYDFFVAQAKADYAAGRYSTETVAEHMRRVKNKG